MEELLLGLGVSLTSNVIYDFLKSSISQQKISKEELTNELEKFLNIENAKIIAEKIIDFTAENGDINISGTYIYAENSITMKSANGTKFSFGNGSSSETSKTRIDAGKGAKIEGKGGAQIRQNPDGSISFLV
jgi:hypothetical protein